MNANGTYTYTPDANFNGSDSFTFQATDDSKAKSNIATVKIIVTSVNDAPVATDGTLTTIEGGTSNGTLKATDADGDALTYTVAKQPANGMVTVNTDGTFIYTLNGSETTTDSFTYKANDGALNSNVATVTITVTQPSTSLGSKITGGGLITSDKGGRASFNLNVQSSNTDGTVKGKVDYNDSKADVFIRSTSITSLVVNGTTARIFGKATRNGAGSFDFVIDVTDNGEPGEDDTYQIRLNNGFTNGPKMLDGGNIQVHK